MYGCMVYGCCMAVVWLYALYCDTAGPGQGEFVVLPDTTAFRVVLLQGRLYRVGRKLGGRALPEHIVDALLSSPMLS